MTVSFDEILRLSVAERIELVEDILDSLADSPDLPPVTDAQRRELDRRLDMLPRDDRALTSWADIRAELDRAE